MQCCLLFCLNILVFDIFLQDGGYLLRKISKRAAFCWNTKENVSVKRKVTIENIATNISTSTTINIKAKDSGKKRLIHDLYLTEISPIRDQIYGEGTYFFIKSLTPHSLG